MIDVASQFVALVFFCTMGTCEVISIHEPYDTVEECQEAVSVMQSILADSGLFPVIVGRCVRITTGIKV